jgi:hypothetical protein
LFFYFRFLFFIGSLLLPNFAAATTKTNLLWHVRKCNPPLTGKLGAIDVLPGGDPCVYYTGNMLLYISASRSLYVCENGVAVKANLVSGGKGGTNKTRLGDRKTPTGVYTLGTPRPSANFGIFIPIGYPNEEDKRLKRTGDHVGIHGPMRQYACDGAGNIGRNWTNGCLAYAADKQVYDLSLWLLARPDAYIVLK